MYMYVYRLKPQFNDQISLMADRVSAVTVYYYEPAVAIAVIRSKLKEADARLDWHAALYM